MGAKECIGIVGLGLVGSALSESLLAAGFDVIGCDIDGSKVERLVAAGGRGAATPAEVAAGARRVILSLMNTAIVEQVVEGKDGLLEAPRLRGDAPTPRFRGGLSEAPRETKIAKTAPGSRADTPTPRSRGGLSEAPGGITPTEIAPGGSRGLGGTRGLPSGKGVSPPLTIIDTTTGEPEAVEALAGRLAARGVAYLAATISGSSGQIRRREGVLMVGGEPAAFEACADVFRAVAAEHAFHVGPAGSGCRAKLAVNLILGLNRAALAEGLVFAERLGLDLPGFLELARHTAAYSRVMDVKGRRMIEEDFAPEARLAQHRKDVGIILDCAARAGQRLPLSEAHRAILDAAIAAGDGDLDNAAIIRQIRRSGSSA